MDIEATGKELAAGEFQPVGSGAHCEGLSFDFKRNLLWYSDPFGGGVYSVTPEGLQMNSFNEDRKWIAGVLMNDDGSVFSSGAGGIMWNHPETGKSGWLLDELKGKPINGVNEMAPDGTGGIYFGTIDIENIKAGKDMRPGALYRLAADGAVTLLWDGIGFANGIMYDRARKRFYCNDSFNCIWAFDVGEDLTLKNQTEFLSKKDGDGMALDAEGNLWITGFRSPFIERIKPDGTILPKLQTPQGGVTQLRFGGADLRDYYICAIEEPEKRDLKAKASIVYRGRSETVGQAVLPAEFKLD